MALDAAQAVGTDVGVPCDVLRRRQQHSPEFARRWSAQLVGLRQSEEKRICHTEVGERQRLLSVISSLG